MSEPVPSALLDQIRAALGSQYEIERALGAGGMGSVLLGRDRTLDRAVAIKVISPELSAAKSFRQRFLQEARTVARLRHPHIVAVYAAGEADGLLYFVMEYIPGESLRDLIDREGRVEPARAARILRQLADALGYAHGQGVIHRDIKPENILLDAESGRAMITDFGVAQALSSGDERMTGTGFIVGSPRYMSPEQAAGERHLDGRSDIYSLGLVGYEMVAGTPAFGGDSAVSILAKQITSAPEPLRDAVSDVPPALEMAIERALAKDPGRRWQDAAEMATALGEPSGEAAGGAAGGARPRRRTWLLASGAMAVVAVLAVLAIAFGVPGGNGIPAGVDPRKSFLIVPFENQTGDPQLGWLREGSVNMLTLNLSEWRDLTIVDYERTLDLLDDAELGENGRIGLEEARGLARRAGVWTAVLGSISRQVRDSLTVTARVYDVATGRQVDDAQVTAPLDADPRGIFDRLSRELLDLAGAPALVVEHAKITSTSLEAYRAYLAGVRALNSFDLDSADTALGRAIAADSTFALAYYKRALLRGWRKTIGDTSDILFSRLAARHAGRLPERERMLVNAHLALSEGIQASMTGQPDVATRHLRDAQAKYAALTRRDSMDAEVWYGLGDAYVHEPASGEATVRLMQNAMHAFRRTLALDSTLHLAYPHLLTIYTASGIDNSPMMLVGDSLIHVDSAARQRIGAAAIDSARQRARDRSLATAQHWVIHDPNAREAHEALANAHAAGRDYAAAASALRNALARPDVQAPEFPFRIALYELYAGRPREALATLRAATAEHGVEPLREYGDATRLTNVFSSVTVAAYLGKPALIDTIRTMLLELDPELPGAFGGRGRTPTERFVDPWVAITKAALGMDFTKVRAPLDAVATQFDPTRPGVPRQARELNSLLMYSAFVISRDTMYYDALRRWEMTPEKELPEIRALLAVARGDSAAIRSAAAQIQGPPRDSDPFSGFLRGETLAELGDIRGAIAAYESIEMSRTPPLQGLPDLRWPLYARSHLARGQMYEELGERAKAEAAYQQFIDLWQDADAELQPQLRAARAGLARLRDRPAT